MKKIILLCSFFTMMFAANAQNVEKMCCQDVDFYLITTEASEIDSTTTMIDLSMQQPKLTTIPDCVMTAKNVTYLNVSFNRVATIPESFKELQKLECLDLSGNHYLKNLPDFLNEMPNLKIVKLQDMSEITASKREDLKKQFPNITFIF